MLLIDKLDLIFEVLGDDRVDLHWISMVQAQIMRARSGVRVAVGRRRSTQLWRTSGESRTRGGFRMSGMSATCAFVRLDAA